MLRASDQFFGAELLTAKNAEWAGQDPGGAVPANHEIVVSFGNRPDLASLHLAILHTALAFREAHPEKRSGLFAEIFPESTKDSALSAEFDPDAGEPLDISAFETAVEAYGDDYEQNLEQRRQILVDDFFRYHVDQQGQLFDRPAFEELELRGFQAEEEALVAATETFLDNLPSLDDFTGDDLRRMLIDHAILERWKGSDDNVADQAMPLVYDQLRRIAVRFLRNERAHHTLQATAVVNEVYLRLQEETGVEFESRRHFVGRVAHMMRHFLIDYARERNAHKRGGGWRRVTMVAAEGAQEEPSDLVALEDALLSLEAKDPEMARLVELRYFGGLTLEETAEVLGISRANVVLKWRRTRAWLHREMQPKDGS